MGIYRSDFSSVTVTGSGSGSGSGIGSGSGSGGGPEVKVAITARSNINKNDMVQLLPSADAVKIVRSDCAAMRPGSNQLQDPKGVGLAVFVTADKRILGRSDVNNGIVGEYYEYGADGRILNTYTGPVDVFDKAVPLNGNGFILNGYEFFTHAGASPVGISTQIDKPTVVPSTGNTFWLVGSGTVEYWDSSATRVFRENINQTVTYDCATLNDGSLVTGAFIVKKDKSITNYTSLSIGGVYYSGNSDHFWAVSQDRKTAYTFSTSGKLINTFSVDDNIGGTIIPYNDDLIYQYDNTYYLPADKTKSIWVFASYDDYPYIAVDPVLNILYAVASDKNTNPGMYAYDLKSTDLKSIALNSDDLSYMDGITGMRYVSDGTLLVYSDEECYSVKTIYTQFLGISLGDVKAGAAGYANAANDTYIVNSYYGPQACNIPPPVKNGPIPTGAGAKLLSTNCTVYSSTYSGASS